MRRLQLCLLASRAPPTRRPSFDHALSKFFSARCNQTTHTHLVHHTRAFLHRRALTSSTFASTLWQDRGPTWCLLEDWRVHPWKCQQRVQTASSRERTKSPKCKRLCAPLQDGRLAARRGVQGEPRGLPARQRGFCPTEATFTPDP